MRSFTPAASRPRLSECPAPELVLALAFVALAGVGLSRAQSRTLESDAHHLRVTEEREWASFPEEPDSETLEIRFSGVTYEDTLTLELRQEDVKQGWTVALNGESLGELVRNEQLLTTYFAVPAALLKTDENEITVRQDGSEADDVRVGPVRLHEASPSRLLSEAAISVSMREQPKDRPVPARITIVDDQGALQPLESETETPVAVRPGVIYSAEARVKFSVPGGTYTIYAGRGPEYSVDSTTIRIPEGETVERSFSLERVVDTKGWIASDPHTHTFTHSGHGDATVEERVITLAGEGIELPIATDHNVHVDYGPAARRTGVRQYFTPVIGNEVTTPVGHFNAFPIEKDSPVPPYDLNRWNPLLEGIWSTPGVEVVILNHGRDVHGGFRPFGPAHFNPVTGRNRDGWPVEYNAMEIVNSSAQQVDLMRLTRDWFALLNRGQAITPVGSSDGHDVNRYIVGQGRTYIRVPDGDPSEMPVDRAMDRLREGRVTVSEGLFAELEVEHGVGPGELAAADGPVRVEARVQGPAWVRARSAALFLNGRKIRETTIGPDEGNRSGLKWSATWELEEQAHDGYLVLVARGPGIQAPYWPIPKPYQHTRIHYQPEVIAVTGAVRFDADGDDSFTSPRGYAEELVRRTGPNAEALIDRLTSYDRAVAAQAVEVFRDEHPDAWDEAALTDELSETAPEVRAGIDTYLNTLDP